MISLANAKAVISFLTFLMAYTVVVSIAGFFRAWVAKRVGDDTAEQLGFLTLNPLMHIDFFGIIFLAIFGFGWGRYVPINPFSIHDPWRRLKLVAAYLSDMFIYFAMALVGITLLVSVFGVKMLYTARNMLVCMQRMTHLYLVDECPDLSSLAITLSFIVIALVSLSVILGVLDLILNGFSLLLLLILDRSASFTTYNTYAVILVPFFIIFFLSEPMRLFAIYLISHTGFAIASLLGMV